MCYNNNRFNIIRTEGLNMTTHDKEYEKLYKQYKHSGFEFGYGTRIGKSKVIFEDVIKLISSSKEITMTFLYL